MENSKIIKIDEEYIYFDNGIKLLSEHEQDCCEAHYLDFSELSINDFDGLVFNLMSDSFFERIDSYGIELKPLNGNSIKIPAYSVNNGYYSDKLDLVLIDKNGVKKIFDITDCQIDKYNDDDFYVKKTK